MVLVGVTLNISWELIKISNYIENVNSYTMNELYDILKPVIKKVVKKYNYANTESDKLEYIVKDTINYCCNSLTKDKVSNFDNLFLEEFTISC